MITNPSHMTLEAKHRTRTLFGTRDKMPALSMAHITVFDQGYPKKTVSLRGETFQLGFAADNDLQIHDGFVSSYHCEIQRENGVFFIRDTGSRNGTYLNQIKIKETALQHNNFIQIGKTLLQFNTEEPKLKTTNEFEGILSKNPLMHQVFESIQKVAPMDNTICIYGETGTGKELIAKAIHNKSRRRSKPFIVVNCGAIPRDLIESVLFGHVSGAFTGAHKNSTGSFASANGGTLFLDEIGELPVDLQPKLLRAIEQKEIQPVGAERVKKINVRILAATHRDLAQMVSENKFRQDLFYRLHVIPLYLLPLRDRKEDISLLLQHFLREISITPKAIKLLSDYNWPGNIRELKNIVERLQVTKDCDIVTEKEVRIVLNAARTKSFSHSLKNMEREMLRDNLKQRNWNRTETARALGMAKTTLFDKIRRFKLTPSSD